MKENVKRLTFDLPKDMHKWLKEYSLSREMSMADVIRVIIQELQNCQAKDKQ